VRTFAVALLLLCAAQARPAPVPPPRQFSFGGEYDMRWNGRHWRATFAPGGDYRAEDGVVFIGRWGLEGRTLTVEETIGGYMSKYKFRLTGLATLRSECGQLELRRR